MLNKLRTLSLSSLALFLIAIAHTGISPLCLFIPYEPDIPDCLKAKM